MLSAHINSGVHVALQGARYCARTGPTLESILVSATSLRHYGRIAIIGGTRRWHRRGKLLPLERGAVQVPDVLAHEVTCPRCAQDLFDSNRPSDPEKEWISIYFEADLHALLNSLETKASWQHASHGGTPCFVELIMQSRVFARWRCELHFSNICQQ